MNLNNMDDWKSYVMRRLGLEQVAELAATVGITIRGRPGTKVSATCDSEDSNPSGLFNCETGWLFDFRKWESESLADRLGNGDYKLGWRMLAKEAGVSIHRGMKK